MTVLFTITHPPVFTPSTAPFTSVTLTGSRIFQRMTQINIDSNGSNPTAGNLTESALRGTIDATATEFSQVCNAVQGMVVGDQRTLHIEGSDTQTPGTFVVTGVSVPVPGAHLASYTRELDPGIDVKDETGT